MVDLQLNQNLHVHYFIIFLISYTVQFRMASRQHPLIYLCHAQLAMREKQTNKKNDKQIHRGSSYSLILIKQIDSIALYRKPMSWLIYFFSVTHYFKVSQAKLDMCNPLMMESCHGKLDSKGKLICSTFICRQLDLKDKRS